MKIHFALCAFCITVLTSGLAQETNKLIRILDYYAELNRQHILAFENKNLQKQKLVDQKLDSMHENVFLPMLASIESQFCQKSKSELLNAYLNMMETIGHSASEEPRWTFAKMYICDPEFVINEVRSRQSRNQLLSELSFGFENVIFLVDTTELNIRGLRLKLSQH